MMYLSPVWDSLPERYRPLFGYIKNAMWDTQGPIGGLRAGYPWLMDNGAYLDKWTEDAWLSGLQKWADYRATCIGAVVPDMVGDADGTLAMFVKYAPVVRQHGYSVAFVTQDGLQMEDVPWSDFDILFVGGTDQHKLSESMPFVLEAKHRGLWVHIGRVNSAKRMHKFWMADSCDGTSLAIEPSPRNARRFLRAVNEINAKKRGKLLWE